MSSQDKLQEALRMLELAIRDEGSHPDIHRKIMKRHRREWPALWRAIDALLNSGTTRGTT